MTRSSSTPATRDRSGRACSFRTGVSAEFVGELERLGLTTHRVPLFELFGKAGGGPACATLYLPRTLSLPASFPARYTATRARCVPGVNGCPSCSEWIQRSSRARRAADAIVRTTYLPQDLEISAPNALKPQELRRWSVPMGDGRNANKGSTQMNRLFRPTVVASLIAGASIAGHGGCHGECRGRRHRRLHVFSDNNELGVPRHRDRPLGAQLRAVRPAARRVLQRHARRRGSRSASSRARRASWCSTSGT